MFEQYTAKHRMPCCSRQMPPLRFVLSILVLLLLALSATATVVTNTTCGLSIASGASVQQTNPTSCSVTLPYPAAGSTGFAEATVSASSTGTSTGYSLYANAVADAGPASFNAPTMTGYATASAADSLLLYTAGPVTQGQISYFASISLAPGPDAPDANTASIQVGSLQTSCTQGPGGTPFCTGNLG